MVVALTMAFAISALADETPFRIRRRAKAAVGDPGSVFSRTEDGRLREQRDIALKAGDASYTIRYMRHVLQSEPHRLEPEIWPLGLVRPEHNGWRGDGMLGVDLRTGQVGWWGFFADGMSGVIHLNEADGDEWVFEGDDFGSDGIVHRRVVIKKLDDNRLSGRIEDTLNGEKQPVVDEEWTRE